MNFQNALISRAAPALRALLFGLAASAATAQSLPRVNGLSVEHGAPGDTVLISGSDFDPTPANNTVFFGAVRAAVTEGSPTQLTTAVPAGASFAPVSVTTLAGLSAFSGRHFLPSYAPVSALAADSFAPGLSLPLHGPKSIPWATAVGDFDGDGKPDLAAVGQGYLSVIRNLSVAGSLSRASFSPPVVFPYGGSPCALVVADIDGDGKLDIATADFDGFVSVFRNLGATGMFTPVSFAAPVRFPVGSGALCIAYGDLDGDGKVDLAVGSTVSKSISILRNKGIPGRLDRGTFADPANVAVGNGSNQIAIRDLDGDGRPDITVAAYNQISVLRNTSPGGQPGGESFAPAILLPALSFNASFAIVDLDGDGKPDLLAVGYKSPQGPLTRVFRNNTAPGEISPASFVSCCGDVVPSAELAPSIAVGDIDGDGRPDVVAEVGNGGVWGIRSTVGPEGNPAFQSYLFGTEPVGGPWYSVGYSILALADLDGDGKPEILSTSSSINEFGGSVIVKRNFASATVETPRALVNGKPVEFGSITAIGPPEVTLSSSFGNATILYTLDGSEPLPSSALYARPFSVANPFTLRAIAYSSDFSKSAQTAPISVVPIAGAQITASVGGGGRLLMDPPQGSFQNVPQYPLGSVVTLKGIPEPDWYFDHWGQDFSGTNPVLQITVDRRHFVAAYFKAVPKYTLTIPIKGGGIVNSTPVNDGPKVQGTEMRLTAVALAGWTFVGWSGDAAGSGPNITVVMDRDKTVEPIFGTPLGTTVVGHGSVQLSPASGPYPFGSTVRLTAIPEEGNYFALWGNAASGSQNPLDFVVTKTNQTVSALFAATPDNNRSLTTLILGKGAVERSPSKNLYNNGELVSLKAKPDAGQYFDGWSGDAGGKANPLGITMNANKTVTATFLEAAPKIVKSPLSQTVEEGSILTLTVTSSGLAPFTYQWFHGADPIPNSNASSLTIQPVESSTAGSYTVTASNGSGSATSAAADITVSPLPPLAINFYAGITVAGVVGKTYSIQYATDLNPPPNWTTLDNITLTAPVQIFFDLQSPKETKRYYRTILAR